MGSIHAEALLLGRLVSDLRTLSLAEAGELSLKMEVIPLGGWLRSLVESLRAAFQEHGVDLQLDIQERVQLAADPERLRQIMLNLLTNALQHTPAAGRVTPIARQAGEFAHIQIRDTGQGIPPQELGQLFKPFLSRRALQGEARKHGLGVGDCEGVGRSARRARDVQSAVNEGTTFAFTLPSRRAGAGS